MIKIIIVYIPIISRQISKPIFDLIQCRNYFNLFETYN